MVTRLLFALLFVMGLFVPLASAQQEAEPVPAELVELYGNRADVFAVVTESYRPDKNWRDYLSPRLANEEPKFSQAYEELIIRDFFDDMEGGVFLDVGCWLPKHSNTTFYLERHLNWTGIGIDAVDQYAARWAKFRPKSKFLSYAITDKDGETVKFFVAGVVSSLDEELPKMWNVESTEIKVETITLNTLLEREGVEKIDFLSMDIEGAEPLALAGFDIQRYKPALFCVEKSDDEFLMEYCTANGYELIEKYEKVDKVNWYFRPIPEADNPTE